jgi:hypothetical protein
MRNQNESRPLAIGLTLVSALGRLVPHVPNVTPLGGSCLFAGSRISGPMAYLLPLLAMAATDPFVGGYQWSSIAIYACFLVNVWIGRTLLRNVSAIRVGAAAFLCSAQFFVFTNLFMWIEGGIAGSPFHKPGLSGLLLTYELGLPFWGRTLAGDLLFSAAIFGLYELLVRRTALARSSVPA